MIKEHILLKIKFVSLLFNTIKNYFFHIKMSVENENISFHATNYCSDNFDESYLMVS